MTRQSTDHEETPRPSRFSGKDGVTFEERDAPARESPARVASERKAARAAANQLPLFAHVPGHPHDVTVGTDLPELQSGSSLTLARSWYRRHLEMQRRPANTLESYSYDLQKLEHIIGPKRINDISTADIAKYLADATSKSTRKRRLTSARRFFRYLIDDVRVMGTDPTDGYYPHAIQLKTPVPLFDDEQERLLDAARADEPWSAAAIWLMLRLGVSRSELLTLKRDHIDRTDPAAPVVYIFYEDPAKHGRERTMRANAEFGEIYNAFLDERSPEDILFPIGKQAINGMVERVRRAADIDKDVTPNSLRHTFAIEYARQGADVPALLRALGLADDPRNRASVKRYIALADVPIDAVKPAPLLDSQQTRIDQPT